MCNEIGMHSPLDTRTAVPKAYLAYFPALLPQTLLRERAILIEPTSVIETGNVTVTEEIAPPQDYETRNPTPLDTFGSATEATLGTVVYARSGDKGANANIGLFVHEPDEYEWLRSMLTKKGMQRLLGEDWNESYHLERVEMPGIRSIHFVIYGILGRGVSSSARLDNFSKGIADYLRAK